MEMELILLISASTVIIIMAVVMAIIIHRHRHSIYQRDMQIQGLQKDLEHKAAAVQNTEKLLLQQKEEYAENLRNAQAQTDKLLSRQKEEYAENLRNAQAQADKVLTQQLAAVKAQITAESEKVLKARQEEFTKNAKESFSVIAGDFNKNLQDMKQAFEANKSKQAETSSELRTHIDEAVKHLKDQTDNIGQKADHLASALRGQSKMQGCWGETQLGNILANEGLVEGRDYDREETLRDEMGIVIHNEDTGKRMRPDFILHYPDNTDIVVDCKVSLNALSDFMSAEDDGARKEAAERNLKAINDQVDGLARKDYGSYLKSGHKCLDYTVMYIPNVNALILARQLDPLIVAKAYRKGVLITSEETFIPFLNLVRTAWVNFEQARNQEKIINAAERMIDRVADFCSAYAAMGKKLDEALECYGKGKSKIAENGQSILRAAHDVVALGVKCKKNLPPIEGQIENQTEQIEN